jgi:hypothetical protein
MTTKQGVPRKPENKPIANFLFGLTELAKQEAVGV